MRIAGLILYLAFVPTANSGEFSGNLVLYPPGCQQTDARICKLAEELTYKSSRDELVWQTDVWKDDNAESGTTDGASIPKWAQPIIGDQYDESYLKAAIIHDHYCYNENHVRTWRQTHRMFYDALIDLGVNKAKAKIMYFAVYLGGPRWIKIVPGEVCGENCVKNVAPDGQRWDGDRFGDKRIQSEITDFKHRIESGEEFEIGEIEKLAEEIFPSDFYYNNGATYVPTGEDDPNLNPNL